MMDIERFLEKGELEKSIKHIVLIGSNAGDQVYNLSDRFKQFLEERGLTGVQVSYTRYYAAIKNVIDGNLITGEKVPKAIAVLVGQEARHYVGPFGDTLNVDQDGVMDLVREICGPDVFIGRYRRNEDGSYDFYMDGDDENAFPLLPSSI
jgi:hypothetical protein